MKDREMLELAAKAYADDSVVASPFGFERVIGYSEEMRCNVMVAWDPRADDGDALRLAVKLNLRIEHTKHAVYVGRSGKGGEDIACESVASSIPREKATRRAITRAAAQIGKEMK